MAVDRIRIDKNKLYTILDEKGIDKSQIGRSLGYQGNWLSSHISKGNGRVAVWLVELLDTKYGISYEDIKEDEKKVEIVEQEIVIKDVKDIFITGFSKEAMQQLVECIYEALERPTRALKGEER